MEIGGGLGVESGFSVAMAKEESSCITESDRQGHWDAEDLSCESGTITISPSSRKITELLWEDGFDVRHRTPSVKGKLARIGCHYSKNRVSVAVD